MTDKLELKRISSNISPIHHEVIESKAKECTQTISRMLYILIDNALTKLEDPFEFDITIPSDEYVENAFASEAQKIIEYISINRSTSLDMLLLLRASIGIPNKNSFLRGFRECLMQNRIESYEPEPTSYIKEFPKGCVYYRIAATKPKEEKVRRTPEEKLYDDYLKIQKKLKAKGLLDE